MRASSLLLAAAAVGFWASPSFAANLIAPSCWEAFAPRPVNAPAATKSSEAGDAVLTLASQGKRFVYGGWRCAVDGIDGGGYYQFTAQGLPVDVASVRQSLTVLLRWKGDFGDEVAPSYVWETSPAGSAKGALRFERRVQAPSKARRVVIELVLQWSETGRVTWRGVSLAAAPPPAARKARLAAVWFRPRGAKTGAEALAQVAAYADTVAAQHQPDVLLLGEAINHAGAPGSLDDHAESIPGPTTGRLGDVARRHSTYVAFSMLERSGPDIFNTGVLIDRQGAIAGTYRKAQLPQEEVASGEAPGDVFPVFRADFGTVGLMICHDTSFPEPARELSRGGAELILVPIWGGRSPLVRARAIENGVWLATAGYDYDSEIVDPQGNVVASVAHDTGAGAAVAEIDFNRTFPEPWIGTWRDTVNKQRREDE